MKAYDHTKIEKKWQKEWDKKKLYKTEDYIVKNSPSQKATANRRKKYYVLDMFPYPSGVGLHVGHPRGYIGSDVYSRVKRMQGYNVLHPMGYDAFGLPAEQYAIEHNIHPRKAVDKNVSTFEKQLSIVGLSYDWERRVNTTDPKFYHWTQWIFLQIYNSWFNKSKNKAEKIESLIKIFEKSGNASVNAVTNNTEIFTAKEWREKTDKEKQDILMKYRLAYEGYALVNWCPKLGTVLANDEIVESKDGSLVSERGGYPVEKKSMRQWFMRITAYADKLLEGLDGLNWSEHIKEIQRNWIGKSEGLIFSAKVKDSDIVIQTFSAHFEACYADTFFVIAPDHPLLPKLLEGTKDKESVLKKAKEIAEKRDKQGEEYKDIDGVFTGRYAIDPLGNGDLPIWVAGFALKDYGTGIVKCSAHDVRDFAFAKKYNIPLKEVIIPKVVDVKNPPLPGKETIERNAIQAIIVNPKDQKILSLRWKKFPWTTFVVGGVEGSEDLITAARREVLEETGYKNLKYIKTLGGPVESHFYAAHKGVNRKALFHALVFELENEEKQETADEEKAIHDVLWSTWEELKNDPNLACSEYDIWFDRFFNPPHPILDGILTEPSIFAGREIHEARNDITDWLVKKGYAERKVNYKMRDAIFARQRYWGEPIPLRYDKDGIIHPLKEKELPLKLPDVKSYQPLGTGESPLAGVPSWVKKGYETNTMPGWAGSSWYFLRYMDPKNSKSFADSKALKYWKDVDMYVGGAEHATGHLLYSRFWHKFLFDIGLVPTSEPFKTLKNQGMIGGADGRKMSKRWGNVINPDDIVKSYGADTLRVYEMFMGPFDQSLPWSTESIIGSRRFLEKVWRVAIRITENQKNFSGPRVAGGKGLSLLSETEKGETLRSQLQLQKLLHKTIKKVTEDIESFNFNTAISSMMIFLNEAEKAEGLLVADLKKFLQILAPFAPYITEEIWHDLGEKTSIHKSKWPTWDKKKIVDDELKIAVQVNGKVRSTIIVSNEADQDEVRKIAESDESVKPWIINKEIKRVIYVKGRLINIVV